MQYLTNNDILLCKYVEIHNDHETGIYNVCSLSGLPCEDVLRYSDENCKYERCEEPEDYVDPMDWSWEAKAQRRRERGWYF